MKTVNQAAIDMQKQLAERGTVSAEDFNHVFGHPSKSVSLQLENGVWVKGASQNQTDQREPRT